MQEYVAGGLFLLTIGAVMLTGTNVMTYSATKDELMRGDGTPESVRKRIKCFEDTLPYASRLFIVPGESLALRQYERTHSSV